MKHNITLNSLTFKLRPIDNADAEFVVGLRSDDQLNRFLHATPISISSQLDWLTSYYKREGDWYFVIERQADGELEGLVSLYDFDVAERNAEWGRWILRPGSLAAVESAWLIYRCAFEELNLNEVYCRTVADNHSVVSFHDSCGIDKRSLLPEHFVIDGHRQDAVEHRVNKSDWKMIGPRLERLVHRMARRKI